MLLGIFQSGALCFRGSVFPCKALVVYRTVGRMEQESRRPGESLFLHQRPAGDITGITRRRANSTPGFNQPPDQFGFPPRRKSA